MKIQPPRVPCSAIACIAAAVLAHAGSAQTTWHVDVDACPGPGAGMARDPFCRIQDGVDAAIDGDTVLVSPGTYLENVRIVSKSIALRGEGGAAVTIIDAGELGSVVTFENAVGPEARLEGFTITRGSAGHGGGIDCTDSSPTIAHNVITGNKGDRGGGICCILSSPTIANNVISDNMDLGWGLAQGGGIHCLESSPTITDNTITGNRSVFGGGIGSEHCTSLTVIANDITDNWSKRAGGILCYSASATIAGNRISSNYSNSEGGGILCLGATSALSHIITDNVISDNFSAGSGGGISCYSEATTTISNNVISGNRANIPHGGGGIHCMRSSPTIANNTITGNRAHHGGGLFCEYASSPIVANTILWGNDAPSRPEISVSHPSQGFPVVAYSCIEGGWPGVGNIDADPLFMDPASGDHRLRQDPCQAGVVNPCVDAGDPASAVVAGTTRTDCARDAGVVDLGYHYTACPPVVTYCTAKSSSQGCTPAIGSLGAPTLSGSDDCFITASGVPNGRPGRMIWGFGPDALPFMGGILCVAPPIVGTPVQHSGGPPPPPDCTGSYGFHFSQAYMASHQVPAGTGLYAQYWIRDSGFQPPDRVSSTDGLMFVVMP